MANKVIQFFKSVGRRWFIFLIILIFIIYVYAPEVAIWITVITIILYASSYIPMFFGKNKLIKLMKEYYMIEDDTIAEKLNKPTREIREKMFQLTQKQKKKKWLIIYLDKRYIFIHPETIEKFMDLYNKGYDESEMLVELKDNDLRTKVEIKIIKDTLSKNSRLKEREISVQERRDKKRFE